MFMVKGSLCLCLLTISKLMQNLKVESKAREVQTALTDTITSLEGVYLLDRIDSLGAYQHTKRQISDVFLTYLLDNNNGEPTEATRKDVWALYDSYQSIIDRLYLERQESILVSARAIVEQ